MNEGHGIGTGSGILGTSIGNGTGTTIGIGMVNRKKGPLEGSAGEGDRIGSACEVVHAPASPSANRFANALVARTKRMV
jgi:hypothetical protein